MAMLILFIENPIKNIHNGLNCMIEEDIRIVTCNKLVTNYYKLGVVFNISRIDGTMIWTDRKFYFLKRII